MGLGKRAKVIFGLMALWVVVYTVVFLISWVLSWFILSTETNPLLLQVFSAWMRFMIGPLAIVTIIVGLIVGVYCFVHILRNKNASVLTRIIVVLGLWIMPVISIPLYYWFAVWREPVVSSTF